MTLDLSESYGVMALKKKGEEVGLDLSYTNAAAPAAWVAKFGDRQVYQTDSHDEMSAFVEGWKTRALLKP
jgi:hypothetical protein